MTSTFRDRSFDERFKALGDEAEKQFELWAQNEANLGFARYGLERPPVQMHRLPPFVRYTPDYLMSRQLVEVQGFGQDGSTKLKLEKLHALEQWQQIHPVSLFAWHTQSRTRWLVPLKFITAGFVADEFEQGTFPEGKRYLVLPIAWLDANGEQLGVAP